jgi:hypothetical protein
VHSPFLAFAEQQDLDYAEQVAPEANGSFPLPHGVTTDLVGGELPGGIEGIVGRLRRGGDGDATPAEYTLVVTRVRESVGFARFITCFEQGFPGILESAIGPGGLGWIRDYSFESVEFNRRYRVRMLRTGKESRLRQLFSPVFLDWMAATAPDGLYWDLVSGALTVTLAGERMTEPADVERACELAARVADRIRSEALESEGLGLDDPQSDAAWAAAERTQATQIQEASLASEAIDVESAAKALRPVVNRGRGLFRRLLGGGKTEATMLALVAMMRSYADRNGLTYDQPDSLVELLPFLDRFPMPVMRQASVHGPLPGTGASGALVAFFDLGSGSGELRCRPACEIATGDSEPGFVRVLPLEGPGSSAFGGFAVRLGGGARRETAATKRAREEAEGVAESLGGQYDVVLDPRSGRLVTVATQTWLASAEGEGLVHEGGRLSLVGTPIPLLDWSFETLDGFCHSIAPVLSDLAGRAASESPTQASRAGY